MFYTESLIDRMSEKRSDADFIAAQLANPETVLLPVWRGQNLIDEAANSPQVGGLTIAEAGSLLDDGPDLVFLGKTEERAYFAVDVSSYDEPVGVPELTERGHFRNLRDVGSAMSQSDGAMLAFGRGIFAWHETHGFCPRFCVV